MKHDNLVRALTEIGAEITKETYRYVATNRGNKCWWFTKDDGTVHRHVYTDYLRDYRGSKRDYTLTIKGAVEYMTQTEQALT